MREVQIMHGRRRTILAAVMSAIALTLLTGCPNPPAGGKQPTPVFVGVSVPGATLTTQPVKVLPVRNGIMRLLFTAPVGSVFRVSARFAPNSYLMPLAENAPASPGAGFFNVIGVDSNSVFTLQVQLPAILTPPAPVPADILVINHSLRTDVTDSDPMIVNLLPARSTVTVVVNGPGHVISSPPGLYCGTSSLGHPLSPCSFNFPPGIVTLEPNSVDNRVDHFDGWTSGCPGPPDSSCILTVDGLHSVSPIHAQFSGG
jgi:hypothetical protein